ncbi:MAG: PD-(D/E)XK nuclease family protein [Bryobacteraceae bacterium]
MTNSQDLLAQARRGATLVTASRRLARTLRQGYNQWRRAEGDTVWPTPEILPWDAWLETLWDAHLFRAPAGDSGILLSPPQERALWRRIVERATADDSLLDSVATAEAASSSWSLLQAWNLNWRILRDATGEDTAAFLGWAEEFERVCAAGRWVDRASLPDRLMSALHGLPLPHTVFLAGFEELSPQQRRFLDACREQGVRVALAEIASAPDTLAAIRIAFRDSREEIRAAARWARGWLEAGAKGPVGVVVPALGQMRETVERIFTATLHPAASLTRGIGEKLFNISAGRPLQAYPIVHAALAILELEPFRNDCARVGNLLRSRHLSGGDAEWTARASLDARLRRDGMARVSMDRLKTLTRKESLPLFARALEKWQTVRSPLAPRQRPSGWSRAFSTLLDALGWPGSRTLDSREYQVVAEWNGILSELARLDSVVPILRYRDALQELKRLAKDTLFQPEGTSAPIQILGLLEASGLHFEHLWIAGLHDEAWPAPARPDPFLPVEIQRKLRMPHASPERELEFARTITGRLLSSSEDIVVSYPVQDADGELGPSSLILALRPVAAGDFPLIDYPLHRNAILNSARLESVVDARAPLVPPGALQHGGARLFELQAACPFRAFAEWRLAAQALESPEPGLDERARGILVHSALEKLWRELRSHERLVSLPAGLLEEVVQRAVSGAIEDFSRRRGGDLPENFIAIERLRLENLLAAWLQVEAGRSAFEVVQPEGERYAELGGIRFLLRLDRVDRVPDGREVIVDYKTGNPTAAGWVGPRPDSPQLPLYAVAHAGPLAGMLFGQVRVGALRMIGIGDSAAIAPGIKPADLQECRVEWREVLTRLGEEFRTGHAAVDPKDPNKTCRICKLHALCRVREMNFAIPSADEGDE